MGQVFELYGGSYGFHGPEAHGAGPPEPLTVRVTSIRVRGARGTELRLADDLDHMVVRIVGERVSIVTEALEDQGPLKFDAAQLAELARLSRAWRRSRRKAAAYVGLGQRLGPFHGFSPFVRYRAGSWEGEEVSPKAKEFAQLRQGADRCTVEEPNRGAELAGYRVLHRLVSGLGEPIGLVVRAPGDRCAVLTRRALLLTREWPASPDDFAALGLLLVRGIRTTGDRGLEHLAAGAALIDIASVTVIDEAIGLATEIAAGASPVSPTGAP